MSERLFDISTATHALTCDLDEDCTCIDEIETRCEMWPGDALAHLGNMQEPYDVVITDPPYAFGGEGDEHAISATVAIVLREAARRLSTGGWFVIMCAASLRSEDYMRESIRGLGLTPVRRLAWVKPKTRTKVKAAGWQWASVSVLVYRKGKADRLDEVDDFDWIEHEIVTKGRRAQLPDKVADWMVAPFSDASMVLDPFSGSGAVLAACKRLGVASVGFEKRPEDVLPGARITTPLTPGLFP